MSKRRMGVARCADTCSGFISASLGMFLTTALALEGPSGPDCRQGARFLQGERHRTNGVRGGIGGTGIIDELIFHRSGFFTEIRLSCCIQLAPSFLVVGSR